MIEASGTTGVITVDRSLVVVSWDDWMADATGVAASDARGRVIGDLYPELIDRGMIARLQRVAEQGGVEVLATAFHGYLIPVAPKNPRSSFDRMLQFVTIAGRSEDGGAIITIEDVTDRFEQNAEETLGIVDPDENVRLKTVQRLGNRPDPSLVAGALADESWRVRREAAEAIAKSTDVHAVETLIAAIREKHQDPAILNASLTALAHSAADVVGPVQALLADPDHDIRTYAALALGMLGDRRAVPALVTHLEDPDANVRFHALEALGRIGDRSAADAVAAVAESRDFAVAFVALDALAAIGEPSVAHRLLPLVDEPLLAEPAVNCVGLLGSEEVVGPLVQRLGRPGTPTRAIAIAIERIHDRLEEFFGEGGLVADVTRSTITPESISQMLASVEGSSDEELHGLITVLGWQRGAGIDAVLARLLSHPGVGPHAADVLGDRGIDAAPEIIAAGRDLAGDARRLAAVALRRIGWDVTTPLLITWLDDDPPVIVAAAGALGAIGDSRAFYPLLRILGHPMATVRQAAVSALHSIGHPDMPSVIASRLSDPQPEVREAAARVAGYFGYARCLDRLIGLTTDPVPAVRRVAVESLASYEDRTAWLAIANAASSDENPMVRAAAIRMARDPRAREMDALLESAPEDPNLWVRYHGVYSLAERERSRRGASPKLAAKLVERARVDPAPPVRIAALECIAQLHLERGLPVMIAAVSDPVPDIAAAATAALGSFNVAESRSTLRSLVDTENPQIRRAAIDSLGRLGETEVIDRLASIAASSSDDLTRRAAITALGRIGTRAATSALITLLASRACRAEVSRLLSSASGESLAALLEGMKDPDPGIRCTVIEILGRVKRADMARAVASALEDDSVSVRHAAEQALTRRDLQDLEQAILAARVDANPTVRNAASAVVPE